MTTVPIVQGDPADLPWQCKTRDVKSSVYAAGDTLTAQVYASGATTPLFSPTVGWFTAGTTQTGYDQGQVITTVSNAQSAQMLAPNSYTLLVSRQLASNPAETEYIVHAKLSITPLTF